MLFLKNILSVAREFSWYSDYLGFPQQVTLQFRRFYIDSRIRYEIDFRRITPVMLLSREFLLYRARVRYKILHRCKIRSALNTSDKYYAITDIVQLVAYVRLKDICSSECSCTRTRVFAHEPDNDFLVIVLAISLNLSLDRDWSAVLAFIEDIIDCLLTASLLSPLRVV